MHKGREPPISMDLLRGFEAAARHLSFTAAARELFVTQSAISRQIKTLEEQLSCSLFYRSNRTLSLTQDGLSLHKAVHQAQDVLSETISQLRPQQRSASLLVAAAEPFASLVLAPALTHMQVTQTLHDLRVLSSNDPPEHLRLAPDVAIRHYTDNAIPAGAVVLASDVVAPACAPRFTQRLRRPADLADHVLLSYEATIERRTKVDWVRWLSAQGLSSLKPTSWIQFNRYDQVVTAAVGGAGVMLGRMPLLSNLMRQGLLVMPWGGLAMRTGSWCATIKTALRERAAAEAFVRQLQSHLNTAAWPGDASTLPNDREPEVLAEVQAHRNRRTIPLAS